jgi:hypothetical protein
MILGNYDFVFDDKKNQWNMQGLPNGHFINFHKTRLWDGRLCITVNYQISINDRWAGGGAPCYDYEGVMKCLKEYRKLIIGDRPIQLSIFDMV